MDASVDDALLAREVGSFGTSSANRLDLEVRAQGAQVRAIIPLTSVIYRQWNDMRPASFALIEHRASEQCARIDSAAGKHGHLSSPATLPLNRCPELLAKPARKIALRDPQLASKSDGRMSSELAAGRVDFNRCVGGDCSHALER
jgi:hypothetical protein